ncbi:MAG: hypothetical protein H5T86_12605, partial [Armatimonadetes bacterium]|nr:hypothetical protein [Armatimonadota bacterium]
VEVISVDLGKRLEAPSVADLPLDGELGLISRALRFYDAPNGIRVTTRNDAPAGSGLGSSSSLLIALSGALRAINGLSISDEELIDNAADIEAQVIRVPTGKQDYFAALYGGLNAIWFDAGRAERLHLDHDHSFVNALAEQLLLVYSGSSRCSAMTNWAMIRNYIEGVGDTRQRMRRIREITIAMKEAIEQGDLQAVGQLMSAEWEARRGLAEDVDCEDLRRIISAADDAGALGRKVCGAGGGGCLVILTEPSGAPAVAEAVRQAGGRILDWQPAFKGLSVSVEP